MDESDEEIKQIYASDDETSTKTPLYEYEKSNEQVIVDLENVEMADEEEKGSAIFSSEGDIEVDCDDAFSSQSEIDEEY